MSKKPAVIVVSSHVVRGSVGNRAGVFALETLGFPVWAVPTVILPWHPGHGKGTRIVPDAKQFDKLVNELSNAPWLPEVGAVLSGYLGEAGQAAPLALLVAAVKSANRDAVFVCDPVIGDAGGLYVPQEVAKAIRDALLPIADITTPNRFELEWLAGRELRDRQQLLQAARLLGPKTVLVTSAPGRKPGQIGNLLMDGGRAWLADHAVIDNPPNGPGDLTSALLLARLLAGNRSEQALQLTTAAVYEILQATMKDRSDELLLEQYARLLINPAEKVAITGYQIISSSPQTPILNS